MNKIVADSSVGSGTSLNSAAGAPMQVVHSNSTNNNTGSVALAFDDERLSNRWKERCARFMNCIENTKMIAERTRVRQESARKELLKRERADMEKYRQRYMEAAMKQYVEQQAKIRENNVQVPAVAHQQILNLGTTSQRNQQQMHASSHSDYVPTASLLFDQDGKCLRMVNVRKRPYPQRADWTQCNNSISMMYDPVRNFSTAETNEVYEHSISNRQRADFTQICDAATTNKQMPRAMYFQPRSEMAEQYDQSRMGSIAIPTTSQAINGTPYEELNNLTMMPELAESHMKNLMDQFGEGNLFDDLGDNCLDGVLINRYDHNQIQQITGSTVVNPTDDGQNAISPCSLSSSAPMMPSDVAQSAHNYSHLMDSSSRNSNSLLPHQQNLQCGSGIIMHHMNGSINCTNPRLVSNADYQYIPNFTPNSVSTGSISRMCYQSACDIMHQNTNLTGFQSADNAPARINQNVQLINERTFTPFASHIVQNYSSSNYSQSRGYSVNMECIPYMYSEQHSQIYQPAPQTEAVQQCGKNGSRSTFGFDSACDPTISSHKYC